MVLRAQRNIFLLRGTRPDCPISRTRGRHFRLRGLPLDIEPRSTNINISLNYTIITWPKAIFSAISIRIFNYIFQPYFSHSSFNYIFRAIFQPYFQPSFRLHIFNYIFSNIFDYIFSAIFSTIFQNQIFNYIFDYSSTIF